MPIRKLPRAVPLASGLLAVLAPSLAPSIAHSAVFKGVRYPVQVDTDINVRVDSSFRGDSNECSYENSRSRVWFTIDHRASSRSRQPNAVASSGRLGSRNTFGFTNSVGQTNSVTGLFSANVDVRNLDDPRCVTANAAPIFARCNGVGDYSHMTMMNAISGSGISQSDGVIVIGRNKRRTPPTGIAATPPGTDMGEHCLRAIPRIAMAAPPRGERNVEGLTVERNNLILAIPVRNARLKLRSLATKPRMTFPIDMTGPCWAVESRPSIRLADRNNEREPGPILWQDKLPYPAFGATENATINCTVSVDGTVTVTRVGRARRS